MKIADDYSIVSINRNGEEILYKRSHERENIYEKCTTCEIRGEIKGCVGRINADGNIRNI